MISTRPIRPQRWLAAVVAVAAVAVVTTSAVPSAQAKAYPRTWFAIGPSPMAVPQGFNESILQMPEGAKGHFDAWGYVTWYNRSLRVALWWRNWEQGHCAKVRLSTTRAGHWTTPKAACDVGGKPMSVTHIFRGRALGPGGIGGVGVVPGNAAMHSRFTAKDFKSPNGVWIERWKPSLG